MADRLTDDWLDWSSLPTKVESAVPEIFKQCKDFQAGKDEKYANCGIPAGKLPCDMLTELHRAKEYRTYFLAILPVVLSVIAFILNSAFLVIQGIAWKKAGAGHRKRYIFLLFRSVTTLLTLLLFYVLLIIWKDGGFNYSSVAILLFLGSHDFFSIACAYLALTSLLYTAVMHPIFYRLSVRFFHCCVIVASIFGVNIVFSALVGIYGATLFYPQTAPVSCTFDKCRNPLAIFLAIALGLGILAVLSLYGTLVAHMRHRICRTQNSVKSSTSISSTQSSYVAMNRLALNMGTFALATIPLFAVAIVALARLRELSTLGEGDKSPCKTFENASLFVQVELLASAGAVIWVLSMLLDPIINTAADPRLMTLVKKVIQRRPCWRRVAKNNDSEEDEHSSS